MKKVILSLDVYDDNGRQKAMKIVSGLSGVDSMSIDMKEKKLTIIGDVDAVVIVSKLRRRFHNTAIVSVGPAKEPEKKKEEPKKEEAKKIPDVKVAGFVNAYKGYTPHYSTSHYYVPSMEDNPNACVIC